MDEILVVKQRENKLKLKIVKKKKNQYSSPQYRKTLNPKDVNDLALFMGDLKIYFNSPIARAFKIFKEDLEGLGKDFYLWGGK